MSSEKKPDNPDFSAAAAKKEPSIFGKISFCGLLVLIGLTAVPYGTVDPWLNHLAVFFICICALLRILDGFIVKNYGFGELRMLSPLIAVLLLAIIQTLPVWSSDSIAELPPFSGQSLSLAPIETRNFILRFAGYLIAAEILFYYTTGRRQLKLILLTFLIIALGSLVFALTRNFLIPGDLPRLPAEIGFGQFINRNHFTFLMEMLLGVLTGLLLKADLSKGFKLLSGIAFGLAVIALILSNSRGGVLSLVGIGIAAIGFVILLPAFSNQRFTRSKTDSRSSNGFLWKFVLAAVLSISFISFAAFTVAFVGGDQISSRIESISDEVNNPEDGKLRRIDFWQATINLIKEHPVFGAGFGAYPAAITKYDQSSGRLVLQEAHNDYLDVAANGGIIGFGLTILFFILLGKSFLRRLKTSEGFRAALCIGAGIGISGVLLHSLVDFGLRTSVNAYVFILLITLAAAATDERPTTSRKSVEAGKPDERQQRAKNFRRFAAVPVCIYLLAALLTGVFSLKTGLSFYFSDIAALSKSEAAAAQAISFDPSNYRAFEIYGQILFRSGRYPESVESFRKAVGLEPNNYLLRLQLAAAYLGANQQDEATESCRAAVKLAPFYAGPQWGIGLIFLKEKKFEEAFGYFNKAADRDSKLIPMLLYTAQNTFYEDPLIDRMVSPSTLTGQITAANYYIDHNIVSEKMEALLTGEDLPDEEKEKFVKKLIKVKNFPMAFKAWRSQTGNRADSKASLDSQNLLNGGFENDLRLSETGFGWRIQQKNSSHIKITHRSENSFAGQKSLKIEFDGNSDPAEPVLSQTVVTAPLSRYQLTFAVSSSELVTGGLPLISVDDGNSGRPLGQSAVIESTGGKWQLMTVDFQTGQMTQAVVINLRRKGCPAAVCPAFGSIFLDEFILKKD